MVVPSRHRSACGILVMCPSLQETRLHMALRCLEGSTMSNLVHRRRRCARIVLHSILCLEGSTPQDRSGADTQTAHVGRCMCGIPYPGCRFALPWAKCLLPFQGAYFGSTPEDGYLTRRGYRCGSGGAYFLLPSAAILFSGGLEGPAGQDWELRHWAAAKTRLEQSL